MKRYLSVFLVIGVLLAAAAFTQANIRGDVDCDGQVGLKEAIYALQVTSNNGTLPPESADGDCDGFSEAQGDCNDFDPAIYPGAVDIPNDNIDQDCDGGDLKVSQGRTLSPLTGATVNLYLLNDQNTPIYTSQTDGAGLFSIGLPGNLDDTTLVLIQVSGGNDLDADDDGIVDDVPTVNSGTFHGLYTVAELKAGQAVISPITDIAWRYTENLYAKVSDERLFTRLDNIALTLLSADLDGDGVVDHNDLNGFSPVSTDHKNSLTSLLSGYK